MKIIDLFRAFSGDAHVIAVGRCPSGDAGVDVEAVDSHLVAL